MHEDIRNIFGLETELMGTESDESFFVDEYGKRWYTCYKDVYSDVPFVALNQQRVCYVSLYDHGLLEGVIVQLAYVVQQENISTSGHVCGLANPQFFQALLLWLESILGVDGILSSSVVLKLIKVIWVQVKTAVDLSSGKNINEFAVVVGQDESKRNKIIHLAV